MSDVPAMLLTMSEIDAVETAYTDARATRDAAVDKVREAIVLRAPDWLTWIAYWVAEENAELVTSKGLVPKIKKVTSDVQEAAVKALHSAKLKYSSAYPGYDSATQGGCGYVVKAATKQHAERLAQQLRQLGLRIPDHYEYSAEITRYEGDDGFYGLLNEWAAAETAFRETAKVWDAKTTKEAKDKVRALLSEAWGAEPPQGTPARPPFETTSDL